MRKHSTSIILLICLAMPSFFLFQSFSGDNTDYPGGSPGGYTGSPGDAKNCVQCHGGSASNAVGWITSNVPPTGYVPGTSYIITVTVTGSGKKGFECSPQSASGALVGVVTAGTGTHLVNGGKAVTQSSSSNANPFMWVFGWTAPASGTGPVTFYGAFTVSKPVTKLSTLVIQEASVGIHSHDLLAFNVNPNPLSGLGYITYSLHSPMQVTAKLLDITGKVVHTLFNGVQAAGNQNHRVITPENLPGGIYFLQLSTANDVQVKKIIVQQ